MYSAATAIRIDSVLWKLKNIFVQNKAKAKDGNGITSLKSHAFTLTGKLKRIYSNIAFFMLQVFKIVTVLVQVRGEKM